MGLLVYRALCVQFGELGGLLWRNSKRGPEDGLAYSKAIDAVRLWARVTDDGKVFWPGPDGMGKREDSIPDGRSAREAQLAGAVERALRRYAKDTQVLRDLLKYVYTHDHSLRPTLQTFLHEAATYRLFAYPAPHPLAFPRELLGLGLTQPLLLKSALKRFLKFLDKELGALYLVEGGQVKAGAATALSAVA